MNTDPDSDVSVPDEGHWYITTRTGLKTLAPWRASPLRL